MEARVLNAFDRGGKHRNTRSSRSSLKTLGRQGGPHSAGRLADVIGVPHIAQTELIYGRGADGFRLAQTDQLGAPQIQGRESRDAGSPLPGWIGVVQVIVVEVIVRRKQTPAPGVALNAETPLIVPQEPARGSR